MPYTYTGNQKGLKSTDLHERQLYILISILNISLSSFFHVLLVFYPIPYTFLSVGN